MLRLAVGGLLLRVIIMYNIAYTIFYATYNFYEMFSGRQRSKSSIEFSFENDWKIPLSTTVGALLHVISVDELRSRMMQFNIRKSPIIVKLFFARRKGGLKRIGIKSYSIDLSTTKSNSTEFLTIDIMKYLSTAMASPVYPHPQLILMLKSKGGTLPAKLLINKDCITPFLVVQTREKGDTDVVSDMRAQITAAGERAGERVRKSSGDRPWPSDQALSRSRRRAVGNWKQPLLYKDVTELEQGVTYGCKRKDLWVDFDQIGWNFVITPKHVNIGDCGGLCLDADNNIAHAVVKQLLQNMKPASNAGMLCCQGANYKEITALYFKTKHEIVIGSMPKIVVKECRCR